MQEQETTSKNVKATVATIVLHGVLLLLFLTVGFKIPVTPPPPEELGMEVNLGNSDQGFGTEQPLAPGDAAPEVAKTSSPAPAHTPVSAQQPITTDESTPDDENAVNVPTKKKIVVKTPPVNHEETKKKVDKPIITPTQPARKPLATMTRPGATGPGGNNQDAYNNSRNQGIAGGKGDQGKPNGNPNSDNYNGDGGSGHGGVGIVRGFKGRAPISLPSFTDDFNENATILVDIKVDDSGQVISASYQPRGSTTTNQSMINIALRKVRGIKFPKSSAFEEVGTLRVNFKVHD